MLNTAFKRQVLIGFTITLIVALISAITSCLSVLSTRKSDAWQTHSYEVITKIQNLEVEITNTETGLRGYIITGNQRFLKPYSEHMAHIMPAIDNLRELVVDNTLQSNRLDSLKYYAQLKVEAMQENLKSYKASGLKSSQLIVNTEKGQNYKAKIYNFIVQLIATERQLLAKRSNEANKKSYRTIAIVIVSSISIFGMVFYLLTLIRKTFDFQKRVEEQVKERNERLALLSFDNEQKNQLMSKLSKVNELMLGHQELDTLAKNVLNPVCNYTKAVVGAIYFQSTENKLLTKAGYALPAGKLLSSYDLGEGLVGQTAEEQTIRMITDLPDNYIKVNSALGESNPTILYLIPIVNNHATVAVLELGYMQQPNDDSRIFLESLSSSIAAGLSSAIARVTLRDLFNTMQSQGEKLENQQEELIATNEELREKSDQLQASEEELKIQQEELQQTNAELEEKAQQLEERNMAVIQAKEAIGLKAEELEASSRYKSEFLANMSHELRTPLNSILILARILKENKPINLTDDQIKYAGVIHNAGSDLLNLINDILDLSKIESGKVELTIEAVRPAEVSRNMESLFSEIAAGKQINFTSSIDPELPLMFLSDSSRVEQILKNLLSNAFKFTPENGHIKLEFTKGKSHQIYYAANLRNNTTEVIGISVTDSGIGIPEEKQRLIFEAFQQADGSTNRKYGGTGLGLSISKELASLLGGEIQLSSSPGVGSKFTLFVPIQQDYPEPLSETIAAIDVVSSKDEPIMLIVEDDVIFARMLENYAVNKGFKPVLVHDGKSALEQASSIIPNAIILDVLLPDADGWSILKQLKSNPKTAHIPIHMMSSGENNQFRATQEGAIGFLKKPIESNNLNEAFQLITQAQENNLKSVLIVEDQEFQSDLVKEQLTTKGIEVSQAFTAHQALSFLEEQVYDCIILDLNLPDLSGLELLDRIKSQPRLAHIPVVINTAMELDQQKMTQIMQYSEAMVLKSNKSNDRLMDEVNLFIHKLQHQQKEGPVIAAPTPVAKPSSQEKVLKGKRILIADDDMRNIFALSTALHEFDMNIVIANNGREALEKLNGDEAIDLVLMDIMMPEMDGYEAMRRIRLEAKHKKLPVIALTAKAMKNDRQKCIEAGASDYISKPVDVDKLLSMIRVWLS
jgi:CheY-like chemotaxis protein/CHASE3 domain sensor protein